MAKIFIVLAIFFTYTLQFYVPMEIVWRNTKVYVAQRYHNHAQAAMRAIFATLTGKYTEELFKINLDKKIFYRLARIALIPLLS